MKPYCHMGEMCIGCSPQLIEGICPDSKAGMIVAELVGALQALINDQRDASLPVLVQARAALEKIDGAKK